MPLHNANFLKASLIWFLTKNVLIILSKIALEVNGGKKSNFVCFFFAKKWLIKHGPAAKFLDVISPENVSYWPCISFSKIPTPETLMSPISKDEELICHGHEVSSCEVHAVQKSNGVKALQSHALHLLDAFNCPFQRFRAHEIILRKILPVLTGQGHNTRDEKGK